MREQNQAYLNFAECEHFGRKSKNENSFGGKIKTIRFRSFLRFFDPFFVRLVGNNCKLFHKVCVNHEKLVTLQFKCAFYSKGVTGVAGVQE